MKRQESAYKRVTAKLQMLYRGANVKSDGVYLMLDGVPVGEHGHKWWAYKTISHMRWLEKERRKI